MKTTKKNHQKNPKHPHFAGHLETLLSINFLKLWKEHYTLFWFPVLKVI